MNVTVEQAYERKLPAAAGPLFLLDEDGRPRWQVLWIAIRGRYAFSERKRTLYRVMAFDTQKHAIQSGDAWGETKLVHCVPDAVDKRG